MLKEIFYDSLKISKFTRIRMESSLFPAILGENQKCHLQK